ncbi:MAG: hypothetical protein JO367_01965 [Actinobacteria bacterium]|nr:hypothetical protein [Actinomycetota bacterium]
MGTGPDVRAAWFDFATADGSFGGSVRLARDITGGRAVYWACVVGDGRPLVTVRDDEVPLPRGTSLEVRTSGLWSAMHTETPGEHWSVGLEAFALSLDDPTDAWADERGDLVPLGFDLEWEATALGTTAQPCLVTGEVLVGTEQIEVEARGWRGDDHGVPDWGGWSRRTGHWSDGTPLAKADDATWTPLHEAPVLADGFRLQRSLCRLDGPTGRRGAGWWERVHPVVGELVE